MKEGTRNAWVGVFVMMSFGALAILMVWFGEAPGWLRRSQWTLEITGVRELQGIGEGSLVNLNGVEIGRVEGLRFEDPSRPDQGVVILAGIQNRYSVPIGATARVYGATLGFGTGRVEIVVEPGTDAAPLPREGAKLPGEMRSVIGELITRDMIGSAERAVTNIGNLTEQWTPVGTNLAAMLEQRGVEAVEQPGARARGITPNLTTVVERIDNLTRHVNTLLGDENIQGDLKTVVSDLKSTSRELRETVSLWNTETRKFADNLNSGVEHLESDIDRSFGKLTGVLDNLDAATTDLANVSNRIAQGEGTAGLLLRDDRLYEAAVLTFERLNEVMRNLLLITGKIREDGYIILGKAPSGVIRKRIPIPVQATDTPP